MDVYQIVEIKALGSKLALPKGVIDIFYNAYKKNIKNLLLKNPKS
jgi:hypothetical protein